MENQDRGTRMDGGSQEIVAAINALSSVDRLAALYWAST
jgi:hypothetical protein